jgi:IS30 family transposase
MPYTHLSPFERGNIELLLRSGWSIRRIARAMGRNPSTISRELARTRRPHARYHAITAQQAYRQRRTRSVKPRRLMANSRLRRYVEAKLREKWSPDQIAQSLRRQFPRDRAMRISHETIYTFVYAEKRARGTLFEHLRQAHRKRRRRGNLRGMRGLLPGRVCIDLRPRVVHSRRRTGDWEADLVLGRQSGPAILTLVERKHGYLLARKVEDRRAYTVARAIIDAFREIPRALVKTITFDNGKEFAHFKTLEAQLHAQTYFAHPYAAWERGSNENTNGLLRQYLPKKTDLHLLKPSHLIAIVQALNNRPRNRLNYRTPAETFQKATVALQT